RRRAGELLPHPDADGRGAGRPAPAARAAGRHRAGAAAGEVPFARRLRRQDRARRHPDRRARFLPARPDGPGATAPPGPAPLHQARFATRHDNRGEPQVNVIWTPQLDEAAARWQALADRLGRERFAPLAPELDRDQRYPWETIEALVEHKFTGLFLPRDFGGEGASLTAT